MPRSRLRLLAGTALSALTLLAAGLWSSIATASPTVGAERGKGVTTLIPDGAIIDGPSATWNGDGSTPPR